MNLIILGPPGSGKGTQAKLLSQKLGFTHISTGALLRQRAQSDSPKGNILKALLKKGTLFPFETIREVMEPAIKNTTKGFILDGTPRNLAQAEHFDSFLKEQEKEINQVIYLKVSEKESLKRLLKRAQIKNRTDDNEETIKRRLEIYHQDTEPVINYFQKQNKLITIDGMPDIETIHQDILEKLKKHSSKK